MADDDYTPPPADAPGLVLVQPTADELRRIWALHHHMWGPALALDTYLAREAYLAAVPLARDGGNTPWMLTDAARAPDQRPILSSCETLRKPAMVAAAPATEAAEATAVTVTDGLAHGIASVFTDAQYRGRGYAGRMLRELGRQLQQWQAGPGRAVHCSVLYSDIGKTFYARLGWRAYPSRHLSFAPAEEAAAGQRAADAATAAATVAPLGYHDLAALCPAQVALLRTQLVRTAAAQGRPALALAPDLDTMLWHFMREDYMTQHIFGRTPTVRGGLCTLPPQQGADGQPRAARRMWALWTRGYYGGLETTKGNTLYLLHMALEGDDEVAGGQPSQAVQDAFTALVQRAREEAAAWRCEEVQLWNPTATQQALADGCGIPHQVVDRETGSIPSLMWYGLDGSGGDAQAAADATDGPLPVEWVGNEKYGWF